MPVEVAIWKLGEKVSRVEFGQIPSESRLEDILAEDISILDLKLLLIGRQVLTGYGSYIDLLALDADGNLVVIELKRDRTPRQVVAQLLDYGSWVRQLEDADIAAIFGEYVRANYPQEAETGLEAPPPAEKESVFARAKRRSRRGREADRSRRKR